MPPMILLLYLYESWYVHLLLQLGDQSPAFFLLRHTHILRTSRPITPGFAGKLGLQIATYIDAFAAKIEPSPRS